MPSLCEASSFSRCDFRLGRHTLDEANSLAAVALSFEDLFKVDLKPEHVDDGMKFIHQCKKRNGHVFTLA